MIGLLLAAYTRGAWLGRQMKMSPGMGTWNRSAGLKASGTNATGHMRASCHSATWPGPQHSVSRGSSPDIRLVSPNIASATSRAETTRVEITPSPQKCATTVVS